MINSSSLEFHETFKPESVYIAKLLKLAAEHYCGTKFDISECSGIPTGAQKGKVIPHIKYAAYMGLLDYEIEKGKYKLSLTELGQEVFEQDPYLHEVLTQWLCHYCMVRMENGAPQWTYLVHCVHPGFGESISQEKMFNQAKLWCDVPVEQMLKKVFSVVKGSYIEGCFEKLNFLEWSDRISFVEQSEKLDMTFVYAFALFDSWDRLFSGKREITDFDLKESIGFNKIFGFNEDECNYVIDSLSDEGLLTVNRQLYPATLIRTAALSEIIPQLYSRLL